MDQELTSSFDHGDGQPESAQEKSDHSDNSMIDSPSSSAPTTPTRELEDNDNDGVSVTPTADNILGDDSTPPGSSLSKGEQELLARLEEQNRLLESDAKSLNSLTSGHSRKSSDTSLVSITSGTSQQSVTQEDEDDPWVVWGRVVNEWSIIVKKKNGYIKDLVRKGIPHHFRGIAWQLLCNAQNCSARDQYMEYIKSNSPCEKVIKRDIARTYPEHEFFREKDGPGQESLFNVMKAYSLHDREVGYCQGSAFIVGLLLLQMPEEDAFAVLVRLMQDYRLREMYKPSMAELGLCMFQLECVVQELIPELHMHFQSQSFHTSMYASSWFLTLFTSSLPLHLACRVMDLFLSEGMEMIFRIAVAILQFCKEDLLQLDMEGMLKYFQKEMPSKCETDPDYLVILALNVKYNSRKMKKLEKEYTALKVREQEEMVELRRLRTENRLLRQRIENLEQESAELAERLIQGQVIRAQEAEDCYVVKRELAALKQQEQATQQELEHAYQRIKDLNEQVDSQPPSMDEETEGLLKSLQDELVAVKLREAESQETMNEMRQRIQELEEANKSLRDAPPDNSVAHLQEELIAVKLREAEANLSMKELRQKVTDLQAMWEKHKAESKIESPNPGRRQNKLTITQLQEELMSARLQEADAVAELKELRQKVMELETQIQVSLNQIRRQAEEIQKLQKKCEEVEGREKALQKELKEGKRKYADLESKIKEEQMMSRIRKAEQTQMVVEMRQKISSLEVKNEELLTAGKLQSGGEHEEVKELQDRVAELQSEVARLENQNKKLMTVLTMNSLRRERTSSQKSISNSDNRSKSIVNDSNIIGHESVKDGLDSHLKGSLHSLNGEV